jgi:hypothetical protein
VSPKRRDGLVFAVLGSFALLAPGPVEAQEPTGSARTERRLRAAADVRYTIHENYFQAPQGQPDSVVQATGVRVRLISDVVRRVGTELYVEGGMTAYDAFLDPTFGFGAGLRGGRGRFHLDLGAGYEFDLPRLDLDDTFARADVAQGRVEGSFNFGRALELTGMGRATWQAVLFPELTPAADGPDPREEWEKFTYLELEGRARTRVFGRLLSPEVGIGWGHPWNRETSVFIYEQTQWQVQLRSAPLAPVYISVRYRVREREYSLAPEGSSNFGRLDRREQVAVGLDFQVASRLSWNVYYTTEDADSSRDGRSFRTRSITFGVTLQEG